MDDSHEVGLEWWEEGGDEWRLGVMPFDRITISVPDQHPDDDIQVTVPSDFESVRRRGGLGLRPNKPDDDYKIDDRVLWWRYVAERGELWVRVPTTPGQAVTEGLWIEKRYRLSDDGRIIPTGCGQMMDFEGRDPITAEVLAAVGLRGVDMQIGRHLRVIARRFDLGDEWERASVEVKRPGCKGMSELELAQWAERYVEALIEDPKRPYRVLAVRYQGWSDSGLKSIVRRARRACLLTEVGRGQIGGELTDKSRQLLGTGDDDGEH